MNPYVLLALVIGFGASVGASFQYGRSVGRDGEIAAQKEKADLIAEAAKAFSDSNVTLIAAMRPKYTTIHRKLEREIHHQPVYRDCKHPDDALRMLNDIVSGRIDPGTARTLLRRQDGAGAGVRGNDEPVRGTGDPAPRVSDQPGDRR